MNILLLGYGDIAQRSARLMVAEQHHVIGACRHPDDKPLIPGVETVSADASNEQDLRGLFNTHGKIDLVVVTLTPSEYSKEGYRQGYVVPCRHLQQIISELDYSPYVFYVSSTGVYGQHEGEWVDESSPTDPDSDSGKLLLQAEHLIRDLPVPSTILRCSGIYGEGRDFMRKQLQAGKATLRDSWTNRIHQDDVASFIYHLVRFPQHRHRLFLVSDDQPSKQYQVYQYLAEQAGITLNEPVQPGPGPRGSKRCSNRLLRSTGYTLMYPTYKEGLAHTE